MKAVYSTQTYPPLSNSIPCKICLVLPQSVEYRRTRGNKLSTSDILKSGRLRLNLIKGEMGVERSPASKYPPYPDVGLKG